MEDAFERLLERLKAEGTIDAAGVRLTPTRLARIREAAPEDPEHPGRSLLKDVKFDEATFEGSASFDDVTFQGRASFIGVIFQGAASFVGATFQDAASFHGATFQGPAWFRGVIFQRQAVLRNATFQGDASFIGVTFKGDAMLDDVTFQRDASFLETTFEGTRDFGPVVVHHKLDLERTVFAQPIRIEAGARALSCARAQFRRGADLLVRWAEVALDDADFAEPSMLAPWREPVRGDQTARRAGQDADGEPAPRVVSVRRAKVANLTIAGADLRACRFEGAYGLDQLRLERVRFAETPSGWRQIKRWPLPIRWTRRQTIAEEHQWRAEVAGATGWYGPDVQATQGDWQDSESHDALVREIAAVTEQALEAVEGEREPVDADTLVLLRELTVHKLEDGVSQLRRQAYPSGLEPEPAPQAPEQIAAIYRALRKSREDSKDEPGAADFYYGEMEMRRQDPRRRQARQVLSRARSAERKGDTRLRAEPPGDAVARPAPRGERLILWLYWLVSGYGLRASRALIALAVTVVVFAFLFDWWGFRPDQGFGRTLLFSIESTSSLFRVPATEGFVLTAGGEVLQVILRLLGPLFFGLALLSLRGRVKR